MLDGGGSSSEVLSAKEDFMSGEYKYVKISIARRRQWLNSFKNKPCQRCGISYPPCVMDFHHRNPKEKKFSISQTSFRKGRIHLLEEMAKCDLLCSNCHRIIEYLPRDSVTVT